MRVAIPTDNGTHIAPHTGRCLGFAIYDIADGKAGSIELRPNRFTGHHQAHELHGQERCGHGHSHEGVLSGLHDCQALIALGMGRRLADDLRAHGFRVFLADTPEVESAAGRLALDQLREIPIDTLCHGHGHGH